MEHNAQHSTTNSVIVSPPCSGGQPRSEVWVPAAGRNIYSPLGHVSDHHCVQCSLVLPHQAGTRLPAMVTELALCTHTPNLSNYVLNYFAWVMSAVNVSHVAPLYHTD